MNREIDRRLSRLEAAAGDPKASAINDMTEEQVQARIDELMRRLLGNPEATREEIDEVSKEMMRLHQKEKVLLQNN